MFDSIRYVLYTADSYLALWVEIALQNISIERIVFLEMHYAPSTGVTLLRPCRGPAQDC